MLKGIDPLLSPDLLAVLAAMGHGDWLTVADANFPASSVAAGTVYGRPLRMDCDSRRAVATILTLLPLDTYDGPAAEFMQVVGDPDAVPDVVRQTAPLFRDEQAEMAGLERVAFYEKARRGFAVLRTTETRPYGNFILRKGVINP